MWSEMCVCGDNRIMTSKENDGIKKKKMGKILFTGCLFIIYSSVSTFEKLLTKINRPHGPHRHVRSMFDDASWPIKMKYDEKWTHK